MKTNKFLQFLTLAFCAIAFAFVAGCEGPEGKQGPAGAQGPAGDQGPQGDQGPEGVAGNVTCLECHSDESIQIVSEQFHRSVHAAGAIAVDYAGGRTSCAQCHSHEGFLEFARTGDVADEENITNPSAWQCKTCHNIHTTFEQTDYAFRLGDPVALLAADLVLDEGNNNTCINCHQARRNISNYDNATEDKTYTRKFTDPDDITLYTNASVGPQGSITLDQSGTTDTLVVVFDVPFATHAYISSTHAGPHHGPQGNIWAGVTGVTDGAPYDAHSGGCVVCHMGPASGHSFTAKEDNCMVTGCHSSSKQDDLDAVEARIMALGAALEDLHAIHYDEEDGTYHPMYASLTREVFNAWWNFQIVYEDRSKSAHNPAYADALLDAAEAAVL